MPRVFIFGAQISDANFILRQHQVQYISGTVPTGAACTKVGVGNLRTEYKYSRHSHSGKQLISSESALMDKTHCHVINTRSSALEFKSSNICMFFHKPNKNKLDIDTF